MDSSIPHRRVYGYRHVSSALQQQRGHSLEEDQPAVLARLAEVHRLNIIREFSDVLSGGTHSRPGFLALLEAIEDDHAIDGIVVAFSDRVTRASARERATLQELLESRRLSVYASDGVYHLGTYDSDSLTWEIRGAVSADYLRRLKRALRDAHRSRAERGVWGSGTPPYGYRRVYRTREQQQATRIVSDLVIVPEEAAVVREIYARYVAGEGTSSLAQWCNGQGLTTRRGHLWTPRHIITMLDNGVYAGLLIRGSDDEPIIREAVNVEPIITATQWEQAQDRRRALSRMGNRSQDAASLLAGLLTCGACGHRLWVAQGARHGRAVRYQCRSALYRGGCTEPSTSERVLVRDVLARLRVRLDPAHVQPPEPEPVDDSETRQARAAVIRRQLDALLDLYLSGIDDPRGGLSRDDYQHRQAELRRELESIERPALPPRPDALPPMTGEELDSLLSGLTPEETRALLVAAVATVRVHGGHVADVEWR